MRGQHEITVRNARVQYKFTVSRNITILRGDSATGKTTLIEMIAAHQRGGERSGVEIRSDKPCVVLTEQNWELMLSAIRDSIVFIDEGADFVRRQEFAHAIQHTDNYYVIASRASLFNLPYSVTEIYGIKNTSGNRYQKTKRVYAKFYPLCNPDKTITGNPDLVIVEDSNAGFTFFAHYFERLGIRCISAGGNSNILQLLQQEEYQTALVIADGAAFGAYIENVTALGKARNVVLYLPESFEWIILKSDALNDRDTRLMLEHPAENIESAVHFSWERFFNDWLVERSKDTWLQYNKRTLNTNYLQDAVVEKIQAVFSEQS